MDHQPSAVVAFRVPATVVCALRRRALQDALTMSLYLRTLVSRELAGISSPDFGSQPQTSSGSGLDSVKTQ